MFTTFFLPLWTTSKWIECYLCCGWLLLYINRIVYGILTRRKLMIAHSFGRPAPNSDSRRMMNIGAADYAVAQAYTMSQVMCADNSLCAKVLAKLLMRASEMRREKKNNSESFNTFGVLSILLLIVRLDCVLVATWTGMDSIVWCSPLILIFSKINGYAMDGNLTSTHQFQYQIVPIFMIEISHAYYFFSI